MVFFANITIMILLFISKFLDNLYLKRQKENRQFISYTKKIDMYRFIKALN